MKLRAEFHPKSISLGITISKKHVAISLLIITIHILFDSDDPTDTKQRMKKP
jgi:hypothetical protein